MTSEGRAAKVALPDLAYLVHESDNEALRYSLRSIEMFGAGTFRKVWIVGVKPDWCVGVGHIPADEPGEKFASIRAKLEALTSHRPVAANVVVLNDDYMATAPITWGAWHMGPTSTYVAEQFRPRNTWWEALLATADWMRDRGHGDILCYAGHVPLMYSKARLRNILAEYPTDRRLLDVGLYPEAGVGGEGSFALNAKCGPDDAAKVDDPRMPPWLSTNDASFAMPEIGGRVREMFPEPSRWEA